MNFEEKQQIQWWLDRDPLNEIEKELLFHTRPETIEEDPIKYKQALDKYFNLMLNCNISSETHEIKCDKKATFFINRLFDKYVDDETLVICSEDEHTSVKERLVISKHVFLLNYDNDICALKINNIIQKAKQYKKVFVYIIGTHISTGRVIPQIFFKRLKEGLNKNNIKHTMILDDVHGMFLVPRDYSIFDYIVFTAHALIRDFDEGMLICKKGDSIEGNKGYNWLERYYESLQVILRRQEKLRLFNNIMTEYFSKYLAYKDFSLYHNRIASHIFSIAVKNKSFNEELYLILKNEYYIRLEGFNNLTAPHIFIRFRAAQFIKEPEKLIEGLEFLESVLYAFGYK